MTLPTPGGDRHTWGTKLNLHLQGLADGTVPIARAGIEAGVNELLADRGPTLYLKDYGTVYTDGVGDNQDVIEAALADLPPFSEITRMGGGTLELPAGAILHTDAIVLPKGTVIKGQGAAATHLVSAHTGNGIESHWPINGSHAVHSRVENLAIRNSNALNTGSGFDEICGTFVTLEKVNIVGFKRGVVFDQSELCDLIEVDFQAQYDVGLWLVNGEQHTPGASAGFTNRISVVRCNFNHNQTVDQIVDDGSYAHWIEACNFNGGRYHIYAANVLPLTVSGCEFESAGDNCIYITYVARDDAAVVGQGYVNLIGNIIVPSSGNRAVEAISCGRLNSVGNLYAIPGGTTALGGLGGINGFCSLGDNSTGSPFFSSPATHTFCFPGGSGQAVNADTSGATLAQLETEVNELKATLRKFGLVGT